MDHSHSHSRAATDDLTIAARSSLFDSLKGCGLSGIRINKHHLKTTLIMPPYLRKALRDSIRFKDPSAPTPSSPDNALPPPPESPLVVFINPRSGGRHGHMLKQRLQQLISDEQVFDLLDVKPHEFVQYGLRCLEILADHGDTCAKQTRQKIRVVVAGGDGTVGWVLGSLAELYKQDRNPVPPVGIIPLGTGNDLSRSFGWGGSFPFAWKSAVKRSLHRATTGQVCSLDSWHVLLSTPAGEKVEPPHSMKLAEQTGLNQTVREVDDKGNLPTKLACYEGVFYNYFSIGMDAQVAYGFHHLRNKRPYLAQGPLTNKLIYSSYSCTQGWFFTSCANDPNLSGLKNILTIHIKKINCSEWEKIPIPSSVRSIVALNLHNYASGRNPWGKPKAEYLEKRGFVEANADDGVLEIFGLKQGWHTSFVMVDIISAKHMAQAAGIRIEIRGGGKRKKAYLQMDGEPWKQPIREDLSTFVEIKRVPFQSLMINGDV